MAQNIEKVYFFGTSTGEAIKIGYTTKELCVRRKELERGQFSNVKLHLLAAVRGTRTNEAAVQDFFSSIKTNHNSDETFYPKVELLEYINWLRQQWWTRIDETDKFDEQQAWPEWCPQPDRRVAFHPENLNVLFSDHLDYEGNLAGTPWSMFHSHKRGGEDFYTPPEIVNAARQAMGDIDLDAASHWLANRVHKIPTYFHSHRSAFDNPWRDRVWLNPPYGNNAVWFEQIRKHWDSKEIEQLCMISPSWAFNTLQAQPILKRSSAMVVLSPTPVFWGNPITGHTGTNHPHFIVYLGNRVDDFRKAFADFGQPCRLLQGDVA